MSSAMLTDEGAVAGADRLNQQVKRPKVCVLMLYLLSRILQLHSVRMRTTSGQVSNDEQHTTQNIVLYLVQAIAGLFSQGQLRNNIASKH